MNAANKYLEEELVSGDLLQQPAWVRGVELDPEVEGGGGGGAELGADALGRVQPMLRVRIETHEVPTLFLRKWKRATITVWFELSWNLSPK